MNRRIAAPLTLVAGLALSLGTAACKKAPAQEADSGAPAPVAVETTEVGEIEVPKYLRLTGNLKGFRETDLAANANGRVTATTIERGAQVTAGQVLAQLDVRAAALSAREATAQAESARAQEAQAKSECERYDQLRAKGAISELEYDKVATQCRTVPLTAEAATARARLAAQNVGDGAIRAPFPGVVTERYVEVGQYVRQDSRVVTIVSLDPLRLELAVPEAEVAHVKEGAEVAFRVSAFEGRRFTGKLRFVSGAVRPTTRDLVAEAIVENTEKLLKPGMFADVDLEVGRRTLPSVPRSAIIERGGKSRAFFVVAGRVEERVLSLGPEAGDQVSVQKGAKPGDKIVTGEVKTLTNGQRVL
jgi:membrane fusion protein, multidrug efflux system